MPREKKPQLKRRPDGRYACRYKSMWFYGDTSDQALRARAAVRKQFRNTRLPGCRSTRPAFLRNAITITRRSWKSSSR